MPTYSTGELAKMAGVTVRTVQYYDRRGVLTPSELTVGGRRIYSEADAQKLQLICFLRDLGLAINTIADILAQPNSEKVLVTLLTQHAAELEQEITQQQQTLHTTRTLIQQIKDWKGFHLNNFSGMALVMKSEKALRELRKQMVKLAVAIALPFTIAEIVTFVLIFTNGWWVPFVIAVVAALVAGTILAALTVPNYYRQVAYLCPECQQVFKPTMRQFFWAKHTPKTRKLTCSSCSHRGYCVEVYDYGKVSRNLVGAKA